jgi:hypothetical protein
LNFVDHSTHDAAPSMPGPILASFRELALPGDFILSGIHAVPGPLIDPIGRPALARTTIEGLRISIVFDQSQPAEEQSISIYHEILEGLTVAFSKPPAAVIEFCEGDFEREAQRALSRFGIATPESVLAFLATFGFS